MPLNFFHSDIEALIQGKKPLRLAGRKSPLSVIQISEIESTLKKIYPRMQFERILVETLGDLDKTTPLRLIKAENFFTNTVDRLISLKKCDVGIHSAKDLPQTLPSDLTLVAVTKSIASGDSLVYHPSLSLPLPKRLIIGTSSANRYRTVKNLFPDCIVKDIRGNVNERLSRLYQKKFDGIVVADAALIRLKTDIKHKIPLPPPYAPLQGSLAIIALKTRKNLKLLFRAIDIVICRKTLPNDQGP